MPLAVLTVYVGPPRGGCYARLQRLVCVLAARGCTVHYVGSAPPARESPLIRFHPVAGPGRGGLGAATLLRAAWRAASISWHEGVDSVFCFGSVYAALLLPLRLRPSTRIVTFLRGDVVAERRSRGVVGWRLRLVALIDRIGRWASHRLVAVSRDLLGRDEGVVLGNEAPDSPPRRNAAEARSVLALPQVVSLIGYCGAVTEVKSLESLVEAVVGLKNAHLAVLGFGGPRLTYEERLDRRGEERLADRWHPLPWREDPATFFDAIDVFVLPSRSEGSSNVLLEAMARGLPTLAADRPSIQETLPIDEMLFRQGDATALKESLAALLADPSRRERLSQQARQRAEELRFDWDARVVALLDEGLGGRLSGARAA